MTAVTDLSPGTVLVAGTTGWRYTITSVDEQTVVARGPKGPLRVGRDELQRDVAREDVEVRDDE